MLISEEVTGITIPRSITNFIPQNSSARKAVAVKPTTRFATERVVSRAARMHATVPTDPVPTRSTARSTQTVTPVCYEAVYLNC